MDVSVVKANGKIKLYNDGKLLESGSVRIKWNNSKYERPINPKKLPSNNFIEIPSNESEEVQEDDVDLFFVLSNGDIISNSIPDTIVIPRVLINGVEKIVKDFTWKINDKNVNNEIQFLNIDKQYFENNGDIISVTFEIIHNDETYSTSEVIQRIDKYSENIIIDNGSGDGGTSEDGEEIDDENIIKRINFKSKGFNIFDGYSIPNEFRALMEPVMYSFENNGYWRLLPTDKFDFGSYVLNKLGVINKYENSKLRIEFNAGLVSGYEFNGSDSIRMEYLIVDKNGDYLTSDFKWKRPSSGGVFTDEYKHRIPVTSSSNVYERSIPANDKDMDLGLIFIHPYSSTEIYHIDLKSITLAYE